MTQSHRPLRFVRYSLPRCLLLRPCPTQHSPYGLTRKSTSCVITRLIQKVVGEIQFNRGKVCTLSHQRKNAEPMCLSIIWCIYFPAGEGHPLFGNHGASRSRQALRAVSCLLRGDSRFLSDASSVAGARVATRAFTSIPCESSRQFTSHSSAASGSGGLG
jgi:hypothetical protein